MERGSGCFGAGDPDVATVGLGDSAGDGEADAGAGCGVAMIVAAIEPVEDAFVVVGVNDFAEAFDGEREFGGALGQGDGDGRTNGGVFHSVMEELFEGGGDHVVVGGDGMGDAFDADVDFGKFGERVGGIGPLAVKLVDGLLDERGEIDGLELKAEGFSFGLSGLEETGGHHVELLGLIVDHLDELVLDVVEMAGFEEAGAGGTNDGQGGFEGVGEAVEDGGPKLLGGACGVGCAFVEAGAMTLESEGGEGGEGIDEEGRNGAEDQERTDGAGGVVERANGDVVMRGAGVGEGAEMVFEGVCALREPPACGSDGTGLIADDGDGVELEFLLDELGDLLLGGVVQIEQEDVVAEGVETLGTVALDVGLSDEGALSCGEVADEKRSEFNESEGEGTAQSDERSDEVRRDSEGEAEDRR